MTPSLLINSSLALQTKYRVNDTYHQSESIFFSCEKLLRDAMSARTRVATDCDSRATHAASVRTRFHIWWHPAHIRRVVLRLCDKSIKLNSASQIHFRRATKKSCHRFVCERIQRILHNHRHRSCRRVGIDYGGDGWSSGITNSADVAAVSIHKFCV